MLPIHRTRSLGLAAASIFVLAMAAGCASDDEVAGSPFSQALYRNYTDLSAQTDEAPRGDSGDSFFTNPFGIFGSAEDPVDLLVSAYNAKASLAQQGQEPEPEATSDLTGQTIRGRLTRAITAGKDRFPDQAARAQADFDCWILDSSVASMAAAAQACKAALDGSLLALETAARPAPAPSFAPPPAPVAPVAPPAPPPADFTVYFDFDSWTLTAEDLTVLTSVINTARTGGQSHISVVGHTDTSGSADYNQKLSVHRANVVTEALVDMGARRAAIQVSGVGETDLAVPTPDDTKEAKNRRAVIGLSP